MKAGRSVILASQSPRRQWLLAEAGWDVKVVPSSADEVWPEELSVEGAACELALRKARQVAKEHQECPVLGADTVVTLAGRVFGKPASRSEARELLRTLSGCTHDVVTGVALVFGEDDWTGFDRSRVTFRSLSDSDIETHLDVNTYQDKAGAYGVQEDQGRLVEKYEGRFDTIVGLPLDTVESLWTRMEERREGLR